MLLLLSLVQLLCGPMDYSLLGSSVHGISQARILEWVAIPRSRRCSRLMDQARGLLHWQADSLLLSHQGSPRILYFFLITFLSLVHMFHQVIVKHTEKSEFFLAFK